MELLKLICDSCGAPLLLPAQASSGVCEYCGTSVRIIPAVTVANERSEPEIDFDADPVLQGLQGELRQLDEAWKAEVSQHAFWGSEIDFPYLGVAVFVGLFLLVSLMLSLMGDANDVHRQTPRTRSQTRTIEQSGRRWSTPAKYTTTDQQSTKAVSPARVFLFVGLVGGLAVFLFSSFLSETLKAEQAARTVYLAERQRILDRMKDRRDTLIRAARRN
ncbi:MAG: hypothetical protein KDA58_00480 [Planctomycetaceae bacterium]|nr:hypothetical protein [Planctomycetaceae bacterium]